MTANQMPLVHQARRTLANHRAGNPFADRRRLEQVLRDVVAAYLAPTTSLVSSRALQVEMDALEEALG